MRMAVSVDWGCRRSLECLCFMSCSVKPKGQTFGFRLRAWASFREGRPARDERFHSLSLHFLRSFTVYRSLKNRRFSFRFDISSLPSPSLFCCCRCVYRDTEQETENSKMVRQMEDKYIVHGARRRSLEAFRPPSTWLLLKCLLALTAFLMICALTFHFSILYNYYNRESEPKLSKRRHAPSSKSTTPGSRWTFTPTNALWTMSPSCRPSACATRSPDTRHT